MNKLKLYGIFVLFAISILALSSAASAYVKINQVQADGEELGEDDVTILSMEKNDEIEVRVLVKNYGNETVDDVKVRVILSGSKDDITDVTKKFDMKPGVSYSKKLTLDIPLRMEQDTYTLMVYVDNADGLLTDEHNFSLEIEAEAHAVQIRDIILSPENRVRAGRALLVSVRVKNRGTSTEEDIKVKVSIPELGISASDYIDELDEEDGDDDSATSEELYMRIPDNAKSGEYEVVVEVEYDDGDETETATTVIIVEGKEEEKEETPKEEEKKLTKITAGPEVQDITKGEGKNYLITISNEGSSAKTYTLEVTGAAWADISITPSATEVIAADDSKTFNVFVTPKDVAAAGENVFTVTVNVDGISQEIPLKVNVVAGAKTTSISLKKALEIVLVILVVLLVIIGLIIGFSKLKGKDKSEEDKSSETYY